ncbi:MAG TPA: endolytic transglycosylase MltG [Candidatus Paceibacterota bacterium]|nr:endolytic transglycosylase MltG [Candidatus Paceibacterota bacterium]
MPHPAPPKKKAPQRVFRRLKVSRSVVIPALVLAASFFSLPMALSFDLHMDELSESKAQFPVTVNPRTRSITEDPEVEALLAEDNPKLAAAVGAAETFFVWLSSTIATLPPYRIVAGAVGSDTTFVTIMPGYREEEVAAAFGGSLGWSAAERAAFLKQVHSTPPTLTEGEYVPGTYMVPGVAKSEDVQALLHERFSKEILARYSASAADIVPIDDALTIASMIERETRDPQEMRIISGIIWNRLFEGMNLQIDATLQYVKASNTNTKSWWPKVVPDDKYLRSSYNTYRNKGLPPGPIANPSIEAVLAALNPKNTDCLFYFHDKYGAFHCAPTYEEHVKMLKKIYGQGK